MLLVNITPTFVRKVFILNEANVFRRCLILKLIEDVVWVSTVREIIFAIGNGAALRLGRPKIPKLGGEIPILCLLS